MADRKWADLIPVVPFGGLHGSGNDKTQFERIAELERDLAALKAELASVKAERDALKRVHDDIMQAVGECGSYKP